LKKRQIRQTRNPAGLVRWATIKHLRDLALLPYPGESEEEQEDE